MFSTVTHTVVFYYYLLLPINVQDGDDDDDVSVDCRRGFVFAMSRNFPLTLSS